MNRFEMPFSKREIRKAIERQKGVPALEVQGTIFCEGKQAGIKEVVDWLVENNGVPDHILDMWEAKLQEWGIVTDE